MDAHAPPIDDHDYGTITTDKGETRPATLVQAHVKQTPSRRRQRLAAIRQKVTGKSRDALDEFDTPTGGSFVAARMSDGSVRLATADEKADWAASAPRDEWLIEPDGRVIIRPRETRRRIGAPHHRNRSTRSTRTITSRRTLTSATATSDPSPSSRGCLSANALRTETPRRWRRRALIGGAR